LRANLRSVRDCSQAVFILGRRVGLHAGLHVVLHVGLHAGLRVDGVLRHRSHLQRGAAEQ
jgi:hypothetical protein